MHQEITELYQTNHRRYILSASKFTDKDMWLAEEIVQEAYSRALKYSKSYNKKFGNLEQWFSNILYRSGIEFKKSELDKGMVREIKEGDIVEEADFGRNLRAMAELDDNLNTLGPMARHICYLYFVRGYKPREIVEVTGYKNNTVRQSVKEFSNKMRKKYA